jgi:hypothetical protein
MVLEVTSCDGELPLKKMIAFRVPITSDSIDSISLLLNSNAENDEEVELGIKEATFRKPFSSDNSIKLVKVNIPKGECKWITFPIGLRGTQEKVYWIWISKNPKISLCYMSEEFIGVEAVYFDGEEEKLPSSITPCFKLIPESIPYSEENIINGVSRPELWPNIWISDPSQKLPQWVEIDFGDIKEVNTVYLTFDTNLNRPVGQRPGIKGPIPQCVRDYIIYYYDNEISSWIKLCEVKGNYQRRRIHKFSTIRTNKLKIEVLATNGYPAVQIYELRAYKEE